MRPGSLPDISEAELRKETYDELELRIAAATDTESERAVQSRRQGIYSYLVSQQPAL